MSVSTFAGTALLTGALFGVGVYAVSSVPLQAQPRPKSYRVIDESKGAKIEQELNDIVRQDPSCRPILGLSQSEYGTSKVILECGG